MDFYLNLRNEKEHAPDDGPSIGIIRCAEKDNLEVELSRARRGRAARAEHAKRAQGLERENGEVA